MSDEVEAYVTKYALTQGILKVRGRPTKVQGGYGLQFRVAEGCTPVVARRHEWHRNEDDAKRRAQKLRENLIKRLKRQLQDAREMQF